MYQCSSDAGYDLADVQLRFISSPIIYCFLSPVMCGPEFGKSTKQVYYYFFGYNPLDNNQYYIYYYENTSGQNCVKYKFCIFKHIVFHFIIICFNLSQSILIIVFHSSYLGTLFCFYCQVSEIRIYFYYKNYSN